MNRMILSILNTLQRNLDDYQKIPPKYQFKKQYLFLQISYERSALEELENYFSAKDVPFEVDPMQELELFINRWNDVSCDSKTEEKRFLFSVYADVATQVLDFYIDRGGLK